MIIKVMRFAGKDKTVVDERMSFQDQSLILTVQKVLEYIKQIDLPRKVDLVTGVRSETALFDFQSFREAWINACVHNTWTEKIPPAIYLYDDRIEIVSYGGLLYGLSEEGFYAGTSKPVNLRLFNIFITCDFSEQSGHGIPQIVKAYGKEAFSFRDGMLIVTIPFGYEPDYVKARRMKKSIQETLTTNQRAVLGYLTDHPYASLQETADACELSLGGVKKIVTKLREMAIIERKGAKNNPVWNTLNGHGGSILFRVFSPEVKHSMKIGIISDTHDLLRPEVVEALQGCECILHCGDISSQRMLDQLEQIAPVKVVRGNNDKEWAEYLPMFLDFELGGLRIYMTHKKKDLPKDLTAYDLVICGHTHQYAEVWQKPVGKKRTLLFNPGSCGPRRFIQPITMAILRIDPDGWVLKQVQIPHSPREKALKVDSGNIYKQIEVVVHDTEKGLSVDSIAQKRGLDPTLVEQIVRLYVTHPGVTIDGIMTKMGLLGKL